MCCVELDPVASALDSLSSAVLLANKTGVLLYLNPSAEQLTLWTRKEATGRDWNQIIAFVDKTGNRLAIDKPEFGAMVRLVNRFGAEVPVHYSLVRAADGRQTLTVTLVPRPHIATVAAPTESAKAGIVMSRKEAEEAIQRNVERGMRQYAAVFVTNRLQIYRQRYGEETAQHLKSIYASFLGKLFGEKAHLYDWAPCGLLLLLDADAQTREDKIRRAAERSVECSLPNSTALISLRAACEVMTTFGDESAEDLIAKLDRASAVD